MVFTGAGAVLASHTPPREAAACEARRWLSREEILLQGMTDPRASCVPGTIPQRQCGCGQPFLGNKSLCVCGYADHLPVLHSNLGKGKDGQ